MGQTPWPSEVIPGDGNVVRRNTIVPAYDTEVSELENLMLDKTVTHAIEHTVDGISFYRFYVKGVGIFINNSNVQHGLAEETRKRLGGGTVITYDSRANWSYINIFPAKPLRLFGRHTEVPAGYRACILGNNVVLAKDRPGEYPQYYWSPGVVIDDPRLRIKDGYPEINEVLNQQLSESLAHNPKPTATKHAYHSTEIVKGKTGFFSKIEEEFLEAKDAHIQQNPIMLLLELADMFGAVEKFLEKRFPGVTLDHIVKHARLTNEVFKSGARVDNDPPCDLSN